MRPQNAISGPKDLSCVSRYVTGLSMGRADLGEQVAIPLAENGLVTALKDRPPIGGSELHHSGKSDTILSIRFLRLAGMGANIPVCRAGTVLPVPSRLTSVKAPSNPYP
jgi:hypothetical protein